MTSFWCAFTDNFLWIVANIGVSVLLPFLILFLVWSVSGAAGLFEKAVDQGQLF
jgi:hypothetical protein